MLRPPVSAPLTLALLTLFATACATSGSSSGGATGKAALAGAGKPEAISSTIPFESLEGPFWAAGGRYLLFSDVVEANGSAAHIYRYDPVTGAFATVTYPGATTTTSTNGLTIDPEGRLLVCERYNGRLVRFEAGGTLKVLAERWPALSDGLPLSAPNDVTVRGDGNVYFTDSDWGTNTSVGSHAAMGVYRVTPSGALSRVLDMEKPNGIALSPDEKTLYVGSDAQNKVWKLPLSDTGEPGAPALLIDGATVPGGFKVPDGICVDDNGHLYVTSNDDGVKAIVVFDDKGTALGRIPIPFRPSNCTFGGEDRKTMYVTTLHAIYAVRMTTPGRP